MKDDGSIRMLQSLIGETMKKVARTGKHILSILVASSVALPIATLPLGIREGQSPAFTLREAYAATFPDEAVEEMPEDQVDYSDEEVDQFILNGGTIQATYNEGYGPSSSEDTAYRDVPAYTVYQEFDEAGLPIEQLDPLFFAPDETTYYIQAAQSILKEEPDMSSITLQTLNVGQQVTRIGIGDTWSKIRTEDGAEGYVLTGSISYEMVWQAIDNQVWVDTDSLTLRAEPSVESEVLGTLYDEDQLRAIGVAAKWYHVIVVNGNMAGTEGYVYISYTTTQRPPTPTPTPTPIRTSGGGGGGGSGSGGGGGGVDYSSFVDPATVVTGQNPESIVAVAQAMVGKPYVWGACSSSAVDCSGLVCYCYSTVCGLTLPHYSQSLCSVGQGVSRENVQPGDIVCWDTGGGYCGHVGIYVGNGQCIDARGVNYGVVYGDIDRHPIVTIRRIFT